MIVSNNSSYEFHDSTLLKAELREGVAKLFFEDVYSKDDKLKTKVTVIVSGKNLGVLSDVEEKINSGIDCEVLAFDEKEEALEMLLELNDFQARESETCLKKLEFDSISIEKSSEF